MRYIHFVSNWFHFAIIIIIIINHCCDYGFKAWFHLCPNPFVCLLLFMQKQMNLEGYKKCHSISETSWKSKNSEWHQFNLKVVHGSNSNSSLLYSVRLILDNSCSVFSWRIWIYRQWTWYTMAKHTERQYFCLHECRFKSHNSPNLALNSNSITSHWPCIYEEHCFKHTVYSENSFICFAASVIQIYSIFLLRWYEIKMKWIHWIVVFVSILYIYIKAKFVYIYENLIAISEMTSLDIKWSNMALSFS